MTTFSTFASRFLSSGLATSLRPAENAPAEQDPLFYSSASGFGLGAGGDHIGDHSLSSSDGLPPPNSYYPPGEPGQSRFGAQSLTGASRYGPSQSLLDAGPGAGGAGSKAMCRSIREIDDEEDVDLWRDERRMAGIGQGPGSQLGASSAGTASAGPSRLLPPKARQALPRSTEDSQDPFLGEHELDADAESEGNAAASQQGYSVEGSGGLSGTSTRSARRYEEDDVDDEQTDSLPPSRLYTAGSRTTSSGATKGKGWLAHRSTAPSSPPPRRSQRRLPADICRDPEMSTKSSSTIGDPDEDGDPYSIPDRPARSGPMDTLASLQASAVVPGRSRYSVYDDYDDEEGSGNIDTSRDGGAGSSLALPRRTTSPPPDLRHPLLNGSPSSSRSASPEPPGAFKGARRGRTVYVYPAPPAASGWGPWANRLALGKYRDKVAVVAYAAALSAVLVLGGAAAWSVRTSAARPPSDSPTPSRPSSYYTITRSVPLLLLITLLSLGSGAANLLLLRHAARLSGGHILRAGLVGVPIVLGLGWAWAFAGSFMYDDEAWTGGGWSTVGLRVLSIIPLVLAGLFARMVWHRRKALSRSIAVVELSARIVLDHPALLLLCAAHLGVFLALTLPFLSIFARLFLVGHFSTGSGSSGLVWHVEQRASLLAWATLITWLWTWAVLRGVQRVTVAGVISHWYFHRQSSGSGASAERVADVEEGEDSLPGPTPGGWLPPHGDEADDAGPDATEVVRAAFARATGPALGTICLSALLLSLARAGALAAEGARRVTRSRLPTFLQPLTHLAALLAGTSAVLRGFSDYALVYVGISGENFWVSAKRAARLASRHGVKGVMEGLIINLVLNLTALALAFLAGVAGFLFSAHQLHTPADAPLVGFLCAAVPYWTLRMCADVLSNAADTLYMCYAIDRASNDEHCTKATEAFTTQDSTLPF